MRYYEPTGRLKPRDPLSPTALILLVIGMSILAFFALSEVIPIWP